jgi:outer membrane receptor protein involved in Fe transport
VSGTRTVVSPKLGARFAVSDDWTLMASSSRGFRSAVGVVGDPGRAPFLAWAHEFGLEYERSDLDVHLSLFRTDVTNERIQDPLTLEISSAGSSVRQGFETAVTWTMPGGVTLAGRTTITDARLSGRYADAHHDHANESAGSRGGFTGWLHPSERSDQAVPDDDEAPGGQRVPGVAKYLARLSATFPIPWDMEGRVEWRTTGPYVPIGEPDVRTSAFSVFDAGVTLPVRDGLLLEIEMRNVFDEVYPEIRSSGYVNPGAPRSIGVAVHYRG